MYKNSNDIMEIIQKRMDNKDDKFNKLLKNEHLLENSAFNEIIQEINTYHAEILAQNDELYEKEQMLIKSEEELKVLFFESPLPYIVLDETNKIIKYNNAAFKLLELNDYRSFNIYRYLVGNNSIEKYMEFIDNPDIKSYELKIVNSKNKTIYLEVYKVKTQIDNKNRILLSLKDITEIKRNEQIEKENTKLKSLNKMINNIAHQWRQPLNLISITASTLEFKYTNDEDKMFLHNIIHTTQSLSETINLFKDIINIDAHEKNKDLFNIVNKAILTVDTLIHKNEIKLINDIFSKEDKDYQNYTFNDFTKVIVAILNNAIDALKQNKPQNPWIKLDINYLKNDEMIVISIEDNGGGIKEDILSEIFEPYSTSKHQAQGVGLSLYLAHNIITELLKGNIYAINTDVGAKFFLEIPVNRI